MTKDELKKDALRALRLPLEQRALAEAHMDLLLQPYAERDAKVAENNRTRTTSVRMYDFPATYVQWLVNGVRREMRLP